LAEYVISDFRFQILNTKNKNKMKKQNTSIGKIIVMLLLNVMSVIGYGQDTIYKTNGNLIIAKINEIKPDEINYHRFDFQDGPMYVEKKSEVAMISFSSGMKQTFEKTTEDYFDEKQKPGAIDLNVRNNAPAYSKKMELFGSAYRFQFQNSLINEREMHSIMLNTGDKELMEKVADSKHYHGLQFLGFAAIPLGIAGLACIATGADSNEGEYVALGTVSIAAAIACPIASGVSKKKRGDANKAAVKLYNQKYN